jgi:iron complex transport system substrate-binding protein
MKEANPKPVTLVLGGVRSGKSHCGQDYASRTWLCALLLACASLSIHATRTVTDEIGRTVRLSDHPHRLVCLLPNVVDDVYALGAGADVVAVADDTNFPPDARTKPRVGLAMNPSIETILSLHPDLVLIGGEMNSMETVQQLDKLAIPVFIVNPHGVEGIYRSIASIGSALNREDAARNLIARLRARVAAVRHRVSGKPVVSVLMPVWYDPIMTIGKHSFITELIEFAGVHSVTSDLPQEWPEVSLETVLARAPDALLMVRGSKMSVDQIRNRPGWVNLPAVRHNRMYFVSAGIELPSPVAFDALEELAKEFHP